MAIYNPEGLYGGGAFKIDTTPMLNFLVKRKAQEDAKAQALDKYYRDVIKTSSDKNVRGIDIPAFNAALGDYKNFYSKYSNELANNRNPDLRMQAEEKIQKIYQIMSDSKSQKDIEDKVFQIGQLQGKDFMDLWTDKTLNDFKNSTQAAWVIDPQTNQPIRNPNYAPFDIGKIEKHPKPVDLMKTYSDIFSMQNIIPTETSKIVPSERGDLWIKTEYTKSYPQQSLMAYGEALKDKYRSDESVQYTHNKDNDYQKIISGDHKKYDDLNAVYKSVYGNDKNISNNEELFAAQGIRNMATQSTRSEQVVNPKKQAEMNKKIRMEEINYANSLKKQASSEGINVDKLQTPLNQFSNSDKADSKNLTYVKDGVWYDKKTNKPYNGALKINKDYVPSDIYQIATKINPLYQDQPKVNISNGVPQSIEFNGGTVTRETLIESSYKKEKAKRSKSSSFVPSMSSQIGKDLVTNQTNDKLNLSI